MYCTSKRCAAQLRLGTTRSNPRAWRWSSAFRDRFYGPPSRIGVAKRLFKIIAFVAAAVPIVLFVRSMFFRRPTRFSQRFKEFQKQVDVAVWLFLAVVGCFVTVALIKLFWAWWSPG